MKKMQEAHLAWVGLSASVLDVIPCPYFSTLRNVCLCLVFLWGFPSYS